MRERAVERPGPSAAAIRDATRRARSIPAAPALEHCEGCQEVTAGQVMANVRGDDGVFRALCPKCRREGIPDDR